MANRSQHVVPRGDKRAVRKEASSRSRGASTSSTRAALVPSLVEVLQVALQIGPCDALAVPVAQ